MGIAAADAPLFPFPALRAFKVDGHLHRTGWSEPPLRRLVQLLSHAPLLHLDCMHATLQLLHLLQPLTQLRTLRTLATMFGLRETVREVGTRTSGAVLPASYHRFFRTNTRYTMGGSSEPGALCSGQAELQRCLLGALVDDETADAVSDEQLAAQGELGWGSECRNILVRERRFDGMDGREAFMAAMQRRNAELQVQAVPVTS